MTLLHGGRPLRISNATNIVTTAKQPSTIIFCTNSNSNALSKTSKSLVSLTNLADSKPSAAFPVFLCLVYTTTITTTTIVCTSYCSTMMSWGRIPSRGPLCVSSDLHLPPHPSLSVNSMHMVPTAIQLPLHHSLH